MMNTAPLRIDSCHFSSYCIELEGGYRGFTRVRMRGVVDNHPIYTLTVQLMHPGPARTRLCVCM